MPTLLVFNNISLDGFISDANGDISWAHENDAEWTSFVAGNATGQGTMLFGRKTYEMMAGYWPTPAAKRSLPTVASHMARVQKVVFSRTLTAATWSNTRLSREDPASEVRRMKAQPGSALVVLGSGSIASILARERLVDEYQLIVHPVILGRGTSIFAGVAGRQDLRLLRSRVFSNGNVLLCYAPAPP